MATEFSWSADAGAKTRKREAKERRERERAERARQRSEYRNQERARQDRWWQQWERARSSNGSSSGFASTRIAPEDKQAALDIINAGYRIMSLRNHPDKGGSHEAMVAVNRALEVLRKMVG